MNRFQSIEVFVAVVEEGSFTGAAERVNMSRASVSSCVIKLEEHLGAQLLNRTTRRVTLTEVGRIFHQRCIHVVKDLIDAEREAGELQNAPKGELRIIAPSNFGLADIGNAITDFLLAYPDIRVDLTLSDYYVDPIEAGYDIAIKVDELPDTAQASLVARKIIFSSPRILCASPEYLERRGLPKTPEDLVDHACLSYSYLEKPLQWRLIGPQGECNIKVTGPLITSHGQVLSAAVMRGLGIAYAPRYFFADAIEEGRLQIVLPQYVAPAVGIYSIFPASRRVPIKVRAFNEFMGQFFAAKR